MQRKYNVSQNHSSLDEEPRRLFKMKKKKKNQWVTLGDDP